MQSDPFGNLKDWGPVLEQICNLAESGKLDECQPGLARVLAYRDNWRLREETLRRIGTLSFPDDAIICQVLRIVDDENLYYEVRVLAVEAMIMLLKNLQCRFQTATSSAIDKTWRSLLATPQPPIFEECLRKMAMVSSERFGTASGVK
jgi:hypothetical protein